MFRGVNISWDRGVKIREINRVFASGICVVTGDFTVYIFQYPEAVIFGVYCCQ